LYLLQALWAKATTECTEDPACAQLTMHTLLEERKISAAARKFIEGMLKESGFFVVPKMGVSQPQHYSVTMIRHPSTVTLYYVVCRNTAACTVYCVYVCDGWD